MYENTYPNKRFQYTLEFLKKHIDTKESILDLGVDNPFSKIMRQNGYEVENTSGEDLDFDYSSVLQSKAEVITAFEIFEHLLAPLHLIEARRISGIDIIMNLRTGSLTGFWRKRVGRFRIGKNGPTR